MTDENFNQQLLLFKIMNFFLKFLLPYIQDMNMFLVDLIKSTFIDLRLPKIKFSGFRLM